jgi:uncharacterized membrane protein YidH (DUF202 family)
MESPLLSGEGSYSAMITPEVACDRETEKFHPLVEAGVLASEELRAAGIAAAYRGLPLERILRYDYDISRRQLLQALSEYYHCPWVEYDERLPVPPELLAALDGHRPWVNQWFPVIKDGETLVIAATAPRDPATMSEVKSLFPGAKYEFRVALEQDIQYFVQDFLNAPPQHLIGNERTGLAFWRNTMARWRTKMACYRTEFAKTRTNLALVRGGLKVIFIVEALMHFHPGSVFLNYLYWGLIGVGFFLVIFGLSIYQRIKKSMMSPPKHQTLVEVTAATLYFLENYQFAEKKLPSSSLKETMLARLASLLPNCCVFIDSSPDHKVRSYLAHERNSLAAQRTVAGCYRTIYARARTGLSFIRTGVFFVSVGFGLIGYFGLNVLTILNAFLVASGIWMIVDGALWYWPVKKEQSEFPPLPFFSEES